MEKTYKQITFFENNKRLTLLENFKLHLGTYLKNLKHHYSGGLSENEKAKAEHVKQRDGSLFDNTLLVL